MQTLMSKKLGKLERGAILKTIGQRLPKTCSEGIEAGKWLKIDKNESQHAWIVSQLLNVCFTYCL